MSAEMVVLLTLQAILMTVIVVLVHERRSRPTGVQMPHVSEATVEWGTVYDEVVRVEPDEATARATAEVLTRTLIANGETVLTADVVTRTATPWRIA